jgi:fatty acid elongase 3
MSTPDWIQYGAPSLDRPFGLQLWPIFEKSYEAILGYKPQDFRFVSGVTALSTFKATALMLLSYYIIIFSGRELMRSRAPFKLSLLFKVHNFYLTAISGTLLALFAEQLIPIVARNGVFFAICDHQGGWTDKLVILYYVCAGLPQSLWTWLMNQLNYLTKFVELIDTCFLFLKKKPLSVHFYESPVFSALIDC